jgi:hypothetical protein
MLNGISQYATFACQMVLTDQLFQGIRAHPFCQGSPLQGHTVNFSDFVATS